MLVFQNLWDKKNLVQSQAEDREEKNRPTVSRIWKTRYLKRRIISLNFYRWRIVVTLLNQLIHLFMWIGHSLKIF